MQHPNGIIKKRFRHYLSFNFLREYWREGEVKGEESYHYFPHIHLSKCSETKKINNWSSTGPRQMLKNA